MAKKTLAKNKRTNMAKSAIKRNKKLKSSKFSKRNVIAFVILFALVGTYILWKAFAAQSVVLVAADFDTGRSTEATTISDSIGSSKSQSKVIQLANTSTAKAVFTSTSASLDAGFYSICFNAKTVSGASSGTISAATYNNGVAGTAKTATYSQVADTSYKQVADTTSSPPVPYCVKNLSIQTSSSGIQVSITNNSGTGPINILSVAINPTPSAPPSGTLNTMQLDNGICGQYLQLGSDITASNKSTPSFLLNGDGALSTYQISIDGTSIGSFNSDRYSQVCIHTTTPLADGTHQVTGTEIKPSNYGVVPFSFTVDTVPYPAPTGLMLDSSADSGIKGDNITNFTRLRITGIATPGALVKIFEGASNRGGSQADSTGHFSITTITLASGAHTLYATVADPAANISAHSASITVTISATAP